MKTIEILLVIMFIILFVFLVASNIIKYYILVYKFPKFKFTVKITHVNNDNNENKLENNLEDSLENIIEKNNREIAFTRKNVEIIRNMENLEV